MMNMREKKKMLIEKLFKVGVKRINKDMDIPQFKKKFCPNEDRTLELNIIGMDHLDTGFVIEENAIRKILPHAAYGWMKTFSFQ